MRAVLLVCAAAALLCLSSAAKPHIPVTRLAHAVPYRPMPVVVYETLQPEGYGAEVQSPPSRPMTVHQMVYETLEPKYHGHGAEFHSPGYDPSVEWALKLRARQYE